VGFTNINKNSFRHVPQ